MQKCCNWKPTARRHLCFEVQPTDSCQANCSCAHTDILIDAYSHVNRHSLTIYADGFTAGRPGFYSRKRKNLLLLHSVHNSSGANLVSNSVCTGSRFLGGKTAGAWSWLLTSNLLSKSRAIPPNTPRRRVAKLSTWISLPLHSNLLRIIFIKIWRFFEAIFGYTAYVSLKLSSVMKKVCTLLAMRR